MFCTSKIDDRLMHIIDSDSHELFILANNAEYPINASNNCNLDASITFSITHIVKNDLTGQYCFAVAGDNIWPQTYTFIAFQNTHNGRVELEYFTQHRILEPSQDESEHSGSVPIEGGELEADHIENAESNQFKLKINAKVSNSNNDDMDNHEYTISVFTWFV
uniref:Uncharacterized protein n=1 Tax=Meloidogyne enterolobii TaxID=390850 RepID=A0A6V7Y0J9_MELEN|nr:unnamed protein product [Meloidogyne enterolobii]